MRPRRLFIVIVALMVFPAGASAQGRCGQHPWCDPSLPPIVRANMALAAMTTDEKAAFLGGDEGLINGLVDSPSTHLGVQDGVPRLGIPTVNYTDGPVGPRQGGTTAMPSPLGLAASWDLATARIAGQVVADESKAKGNDAMYAPTIGIMRTPLGGRTFEAYGEDPFLTSQTAVSWIQGAQSHGVMADAAIFVANDQEGADPTGLTNQPGLPLGVGLLGTRFASNSVVDDRTLHEIYMPGFEAAVTQAHVATVMCSYNMVNGANMCENKTLLQDVLRREWRFNGYVLSDYGATHNVIASMNNGLDFEPWPPLAYTPLEIQAALATGLVSTQTLDDHVRNILATWFRFGVFDRPGYVNDDSQINKPADAAAAIGVEQQAATLLRNNGVLPLDGAKVHRIAVIGKDANTFVTGGGSGNVHPFQFTSLLQAIKSRAGAGVQVTYDDGSDPAAAAADARAADVAIVAAGDYYTEGADRSCLSLECPNNNGDQDGLIAAVAAANPRTVVVLESGGPDLTPWRGQVAGILEAWYPGGPGATGVARVLFGDVDPGGRLPVTFPADPGQIPTAGDPTAYPGIGINVDYKEGVLAGYRWYDSQNETPAFPFGFGLSYTSFRYSGLNVTPASGGNYAVHVTVTNTGTRTGWAVPELYIHVPAPAGLTEPPQQLKGFSKLSLAPGQHRTVTITLGGRSFSYWNASRQSWEIAPGCDTVMVGSSSRDLPLQTQIAQGGASCPAAGSVPAISRLRVSPRTVRRGRGASIVSFTLNQPAVVTLRVERRRDGQRVLILRGHLSYAGKRGTNKLRFAGRIGGRALPPGSYRLTASAAAQGGHSSAVTAPFQIAALPRRGS